MRLLYLSPEAPVPPLSGGRERARRVLLWLARRHAVHLLTYAAEGEQAGLEALRPALAGVTCLPYPPRGVPYASPMRAAARALARAGGFEAVHAQGLEVWPAARDLPAAYRVLELHDAASRRYASGPGAGLLDRLRAAGLRRAEARAVREAHAVIAVSAEDRAVLAGGARVVVVPNGVDLDYWAALPATAPEPGLVLFPAALNYTPNIAGARALCREVLPAVRARLNGRGAGVRVVVAGRLPAPEVRALAGPAVEVVADPPDMRPWLARAAVVAVPLRAGGGTRLKVLQALAAGRPVASTPLGAEGLGLVPGVHLRAAPLVEPLAAELARLLYDRAEAAALARAGRAAVQAHAWEQALEGLSEVYADA